MKTREMASAEGRRTYINAWQEGLYIWIRAQFADESSGEWLPWLVLAFASGILLYFEATSEPVLAAGPILTALCLGSGYFTRRYDGFMRVLMLLASVAGGFTCAQWRSYAVSHTVLRHSTGVTPLSGVIEQRERREKSDRITLKLMPSADTSPQMPQRVRIVVPKGSAPEAGSVIRVRARLDPPPPPSHPGGYDYARDLWFARIGAVGLAYGRPVQVEAPQEGMGSLIHDLREAIHARIRRVLPKDEGAIASALITGKRDEISTHANDSMMVSGLSHILSISGYHMAIVAGLMFFMLRAGLALLPPVAERWPVKGWAAGLALVSTSFYLALAGLDVATLRSYLMTAIALTGVMFNRPALTLRALALAALGILIFTPEALVHPGFQMSFAATLILVAAWQAGHLMPEMPQPHGWGGRLRAFGFREMSALLYSSLLAGLATAPFVAWFFHRLSLWSVLANMLVMPLASLWIMPAGIVALALMPFGLDAGLWQMMGQGIAVMIDVSDRIAALPHASVLVPAFSGRVMGLGAGGLILLCLLRSHLRWLGLLPVLLMVWLVMHQGRPLVRVSEDGSTVGLRDTHGEMRLKGTKISTLTVKSWLAADAEAGDAKSLLSNPADPCEEAVCPVTLSSGHRVAVILPVHGRQADQETIPRQLAATEQACSRYDVVITRLYYDAPCAALLIDRHVRTQRGAVELRLEGGTLRLHGTRQMYEQRPWHGVSPLHRPAVATVENRPDEMEQNDP